MKLFLHDFGGFPFTWQLARELATRGHEVCYAYSAAEPRRCEFSETPSNTSVCSIDVGRPLPRSSPFSRRAWSVDYGKAVAKQVRAFKPDVVLSGNTPLDAQHALLTESRRCDARFVYWLQDVLSVATRNILSKKNFLLGALAGWYYSRRERYLLQASDEVIVITEDFVPLVKQWGVAAERIHVVENWAPLDELPVLPRQNDWSRRHGLDNCTCLMYSGLLGLKHNPGLLGTLAERLKALPDVRIVVVAEGAGVPPLKQLVAERKLDNILLLPFQDYHVLPKALASADALLAILDNDGGTYCVPSKVLTYLCSGRPLLLSVSPSNLAARTVAGISAGLVVDPGDDEGLLRSAEKLLTDSELRNRLGIAGRKYAEEHFDITQLGDRFERILGLEPVRSKSATCRMAIEERQGVVSS